MKRIFSISLIISLVSMMTFMFFEPQAVDSADSIFVNLTVDAEASLSSPADVTMLPNVPGITGGVATGEATWTVITNNSTGFTLTLQASASPALASGGNNFADYTPTTASPDYTWAVADSTKEFGFTVEPATAADTGPLFMDDGADSCGGGGDSTNGTNTCWYGFNGATAITGINRTTATAFGGEAEKVKFEAQLYNADGAPNDANGIAVSGAYQATITATATTN